MSPAKQVRAMKARYASRLSCGCFVPVGTPIIRCRGRWVCQACRLAELRDLAATMTTPPQPGRGDTTEETA